MHKFDAWIKCMNQMHDSDAWIKCMTQMHEFDAWIICMKQMHDSDAWLKCMTQMHEFDAWLRWYFPFIIAWWNLRVWNRRLPKCHHSRMTTHGWRKSRVHAASELAFAPSLATVKLNCLDTMTIRSQVWQLPMTARILWDIWKTPPFGGSVAPLWGCWASKRAHFSDVPRPCAPCDKMAVQVESLSCGKGTLL